MERTVERRSSDMKEIIIGSRKSRLALIQTELIADQLRETFPEVRIQVRKIETTGDRRQDLSLDQMEEKAYSSRNWTGRCCRERSIWQCTALKICRWKRQRDCGWEAAWPREDARDVLVLPEGKMEWKGTA